MRDLGKGLSIKECQARCLSVGPSVCNDLEYGRSNIAYNCRAWTGKCSVTKSTFDSTIFGRNPTYGTGTYGKTYVQNYQAMGTTNFNNSADRGDTQVDNLSGLAGSVQNFGLMNLDAVDDLKQKIADLTKQRKALDDERDDALDKLGSDPTIDGLNHIDDLEKKMDAMKALITKLTKQAA